MREFDQGDWLAQRIRILKPGWRGRLRVLAPEEAETDGYEELIGTVIDEESFDNDVNDENAPDDPIITICANYREGHFVPLSGEPRFAVRISRIDDMETM